MKKYISILLSILFLFSSCSAWLDVKPSDRITEKVTFSTVQGFQTALNGVYIELNKSSLYGKNLTYDFVDIMAKRYAINSESEDLHKLVQKNDYTTETVKSTITSIWKDAYKLIANLNLILKNCETNRAVLDNENYSIIKAEALALRAMLHFDMLRLFGPLPSKKDVLSIPYYTEFNYNKKDRVSFETVINMTITDLAASAELLKDIDPIVKNGINNNSTNAFLNFRNLRLNYYAVKGLQARVLLYSGNKEEALIAAKEVIAIQESYFPFTNPSDIVESSENPDRIFSSEILFALQTTGRKTIASSFDGSTITSLYTLNESVEWMFGDQISDYRFKGWFIDTKSYGGEDFYLFNKFAVGSNSELLHNQMIPMIRVSEMYLIAAECEPVAKNGYVYLNKLRFNRGVPNASGTSASTLVTALDKEYMVEFWGEGQLFYQRKRREKTSSSFYSPYAMMDYLSVTATQYVLPLPEEESDYN